MDDFALLLSPFSLPNVETCRRGKKRWGKTESGVDRKKDKVGQRSNGREIRGDDSIKRETGPSPSYINVGILKVPLLTCDCAAPQPPPPPLHPSTHPALLLLLANQHATLLYLGHSDVLLLSPPADALCCNLRKIGCEEEKCEESRRRSSDRSEELSDFPKK